MTRRYGKTGGRRIVLVDDDEDVVERVGQLLEDDYEVLATTDWGELNKLFFREGCDLVLRGTSRKIALERRVVRVWVRVGPTSRRKRAREQSGYVALFNHPDPAPDAHAAWHARVT